MTDNFNDKLQAARSRIAASLLPKISAAATASSASKLTATPMGNNLKEHIANGGQPSNDMINYFNDKTIADGINQQNISDAQQNDYYGVSTANLTSSNIFMAAAANAANLAGGAVGTLAQWANTAAGDQFTAQAVAMEAGTPAHVVDAYNTLNRTREQKNQLAEQHRIVSEQIRNKQGDPIQLAAKLNAIETAYKGIQVDPNTMNTLSIKTGDTTYLDKLDASQELRHKGARVTAGSGEGILPAMKSSDFSNPFFKKPLEDANKGDQFIIGRNALADKQLDQGTLSGTVQGIGNKVLATGKSIGNVLAAGVENPMGVLQYTAESAPYFAMPGIGTAAIVNQTAVEGRHKFEERTGQALPTTGQNAAMLATDALYGALNYIGDKGVQTALRGTVAAPVRSNSQILLDAAKGVGSTGTRAALKEGGAEGAQTYLEESGQNLGTYYNPATVGQAAAIGAMSSGTVIAPSSISKGISEAKQNLYLNTPQGKQAVAAAQQQQALDAIPLAELNDPTHANFNPTEAISRFATEATDTTKASAIDEINKTLTGLQTTASNRAANLATQEHQIKVATAQIPLIEQAIAGGNTDPAYTDLLKKHQDYLATYGTPEAIKESQDRVAASDKALADAIEHARPVLKGIRDKFNIPSPQAVPNTTSVNPSNGAIVYPYPSKGNGLRAAIESSVVTKNYTDAQKESLRAFSDAVAAIHASKDMSQVNVDIEQGGNQGGKKYRGLKDYLTKTIEAINTGNVRLQTHYRNSLASFSQSHTSKAEKLQEAFDTLTPGMVNIVQKNEDTNLWEIMDTVTEAKFNSGSFKKDLDHTGGIGVHSNSSGLISKIKSEAEGISKVLDAVIRMTMQGTPAPVEVSTPPINTEPSDSTTPVVTPVPEAPTQSVAMTPEVSQSLEGYIKSIGTKITDKYKNDMLTVFSEEVDKGISKGYVGGLVGSTKEYNKLRHAILVAIAASKGYTVGTPVVGNGAYTATLTKSTATPTELKKGTVVEYKLNKYLFVSQDKYGNATLSNMDGSKFYTTPKVSTLTLLEDPKVTGETKTPTPSQDTPVPEAPVQAEEPTVKVEPIKDTTPTPEPVISVRDGVQGLYDSIPKLAEIGTVEEYSQYLNSVFPDSKVKDIVYHGTDVSRDAVTFKTGRGGIFLASTPTYASYFSENDNAYLALINFQNMYRAKGLTDDIDIDTINVLQSKGYDSVVGKGGISKMQKHKDDLEFIAFKPEQIHILGSTQDIEGFKKFTASNVKPAVIPTPKDDTEVVVTPESVVPVTPPDSETGDVEVVEDTALPEVSVATESSTPAGGLSVLAGVDSVKDRMEAEQKLSRNAIPEVTTKTVDGNVVKTYVVGFQKANLVLASFYQKLKAPSRLVQVKDFAKTYADKSTKDLLTMLKDVLPNADEDSAVFLKKFLEFNKSLTSTYDIYAKPTGDKTFRYQDYLQYLFSDGKVSLDDNIKTAITVGIHSFLVEKSSKFQLDHEGVASLLGVSNVDTVPSYIHRQFSTIGAAQPAVIKYLGAKAYQALQFSMDPNVSPQRKERLVNALGSLAVQVMLKKDLLQYTVIPSSDIANAKAILEGKEPTATPSEEYTTFLRPFYNSEQVVKNGWIYENKPTLSTEIADLKASAKGNTDVMSKLFGVDSSDIAPMSKMPTKFVQKTITNTGTETPSATEAMVLAMTQKKYNINGNAYSALAYARDNNPEALYRLLGVVSEEDLATKHISKRGAIKSKNEALIRSFNNAMEYIESLTLNDDNTFPDHFLPMSVWSNTRVGILSNLFNEQGDKIHRSLSVMTDHKQTVTVSPAIDPLTNEITQYGRFLTGVAAYAEGLKVNGKTVDKTDGENFLPGFEEHIASDEVQEAIAAVGRMVMHTATPKDVDTVADMVERMDGGAMSLTALNALYEASQAREIDVENNGVKTKVKQFTTHMSVGSDGVTNGMAISVLIYDAASPIVDPKSMMTREEKITFNKSGVLTQAAMIKAKQDVFDLANPKDVNGMTQAENNAFNAGGIFFEGDNQTSMAQFRKLNRQDLYQQLAKVQLDALKKYTEENPTLRNFIAAMNSIDPTFGTRAGAKVSLVPFVYTAGFRSIGTAQSHSFMEQFYEALAKAMLSGDTAKIKQFQDNYVALAQGARIPVAHDFTKMSVKDALDTELSLGDVKAITGVENKIRKAITKSALSQVAGTLIQARGRVTGLANVGFESYNRTQAALMELAETKLDKGGFLPYRLNAKGEKISVEGMSVSQLQALKDEQADFTPIIVSVGGMYSDNAIESANATWIESETEDQSFTGKVESRYATSGAGRKTPNSPMRKTSKAIKTRIHKPSVESRGGAITAALVQAMDAWITAKVSAAMDTFNHHDENVSSIDQAAEMGQLQNKTLFNAVLDYDVYLEVLNGSLLRPLRGIIKLSKRDDTLAIAKGEVGKVMADLRQYMDDNFGGFNEDMGMLASLVHNMYSLEIAKLIKYQNLKSISQYGIEGGEYTVTKKDVARINDLIASHVASRTALLKEVAQISADLRAIGSKPKVEPVVKSETQEETSTGKPASVDSFIVRDEEGVVDTLATLNSMPINDSTLVGKVIKQVVEALKGKLPSNLKVHMITDSNLPATLDNDKVKGSLSRNAPGITYSVGNTHTIGLVEGKASKVTFIHELIHASTVSALQGTSAEARKLNTNISKLRNEALTTYRKYTATLAPVSKIDAERRDKVYMDAFNSEGNKDAEFVAMAMSEPAIIDFLTTVPAPKLSVIDTGLISIFSAFIKSVGEFLGVTKNAKGKDVESVLSAMVNQTAQLMNINDQPNASDQVNNYPGQQAAIDAVRLIREYPSKEVFNVLPASLDVGFDTYLSSLMDTIVDKTFNHLNFPSTTYTPLQVWEIAITDGRTPYTTRAIAAGFELSQRELFAIETLEVAIKGALDAGITTPVYKEMERAYESARKTLKPESFYKGDWSTALESDRVIARNKMKHLFKLEGGQATRSDYMSRFMAMALASSEVNSLLGFPTLTETKIDGTLSSKVLAYYEYAMDWVNGHLSGTMRYQDINSKLPTLVQKLVDIDHKKRDQALSSVYNTVSDNLNKADKYLKESSSALADKLENMIGDSKKGLPSAVRTTSRVVLRGAAMDMLKVSKIWRDMSAPNTVLGWKGELLNELSDPSTVGQAVRSLLRIHTRLQTERKTHKSTTKESILSNFLDGGKNLSKDDHSAITYGVLRGDLKALYDLHGIRGIEKLLNDSNEVDAEVARLEGLITNETHIVRSKDLAHYMTSGEVNLMLAKNALSIARDVGLASAVDEDMVSEGLVSNIDMLVSLYAIQYMKSEYLQTLQKLFKQEGTRTDGNGLAALMKYHQAIEQEAKDTLFEGNSVSVIKGYTPEITNPHREIKIVTLETDAKHLESMGYQLHSVLSADPNDVNQDKRMVYFTEEPSTQRFVTGAMSLTAESSKGTSIIDGSSLSVKDKFTALKSITNRSATKLRAKSSKDYDPTNIKNRGIAPTYSNLGSIQDFRYEMTHATRDGLLQRNNNFAEIMGTYAGSNFDKASTPKHNETVVDALYKDYKENYLKDPRAYVQIGKDATDPKAVEMYAMLPYKTRKYIDKVWGKREPMWVRNDALLATFGTNKYSIGEAFDKNPDARNIVEKTIVDMFKVLFGDTAKLRALQGERLNQELVSWFKSTVVIRNLTTLMGNQAANVGVLLAMGVSPIDIGKDSIVAFKAGNRYRKDSTELVRVENNMKANVGTFEDNVQLQARLKDSIARNPLKVFLDAGMLNTIVEDVSLDVEDYNYKSKLAQQVDDQLDKLNPTVRKIGANLVVAPSTELYQVLANATQLSDFTAKYALYNHLTTKAKDKLSHEDALAMADKMFINYDVPTSKELQYANDMGLLMFTKYTLRIQRAIAYLLKEHKAGLMAQGLLGTALGTPLAIAPAFFNVMGVPFHPGALAIPGALTQPLPIKLFSGGF